MIAEISKQLYLFMLARAEANISKYAESHNLKYSTRAYNIANLADSMFVSRISTADIDDLVAKSTKVKLQAIFHVDVNIECARLQKFSLPTKFALKEDEVDGFELGVSKMLGCRDNEVLFVQEDQLYNVPRTTFTLPAHLIDNKVKRQFAADGEFLIGRLHIQVPFTSYNNFSHSTEQAGHGRQINPAVTDRMMSSALIARALEFFKNDTRTGVEFYINNIKISRNPRPEAEPEEKSFDKTKTTYHAEKQAERKGAAQSQHRYK